ncbi:hypothetical protein M1N23_00550 [Dehalococcoidia bacterium]|nr:hypothetical protein [Dehalococcoidia bacterium]
MTHHNNWEEYRGALVIPSETDRHVLAIFINKAEAAVKLRFDDPIAGMRDWQAANVTVVERLKYHDIQFATNDLPKETVTLSWKLNVAKFDDTAAGVVVAKPNEVRVSGEKGFVLTRTES